MNELNIPLSVVKNAVIANLPVGMANVSQNGRTFTSNFFIPSKNKYVEAKIFKIRFYAEVTILGDMRPYDLKVKVFKEKRVKSLGNVVAEFESDGQNEKLALRIARDIARTLSKRQRGVNIIDDFRVF